MASVPDICNLALGHLGDSATVASISPPDGSAQAAHCARLYPIARDQILEAHTWSFATIRSTLALVTNPVQSWSFAYSVPANCIRLVSILPEDATDDTATDRFIIEQDGNGGGVIYTNVQNATGRYIIRVTDTTKYSMQFIAALGRLLASYLSGPVLKGKTGMQMAEAQMSAFGTELAKAIDLDSNQERSLTIRNYKALHLPDRFIPESYGVGNPSLTSWLDR